MNELDRTFLPVLRTLDLTTMQARAVAQNIANASVPHYRRVEVDFAKFVEAAKKTDPQERLEALEKFRPRIQEDRSAPVGPDGNSVALEEEVVAMHKLLLRHELATQMAASKLSSLRRAISGQA